MKIDAGYYWTDRDIDDANEASDPIDGLVKAGLAHLERETLYENASRVWQLWRVPITLDSQLAEWGIGDSWWWITNTRRANPGDTLSSTVPDSSGSGIPLAEALEGAILKPADKAKDWASGAGRTLIVFAGIGLAGGLIAYALARARR